jgi:hypothetical protein
MSMIRLTSQLQKQLLIGILLLIAGGCPHPVEKPAMPVEIPDSFSATGVATAFDKTPWNRRWTFFNIRSFYRHCEQLWSSKYMLGRIWNARGILV